MNLRPGLAKTLPQRPNKPEFTGLEGGRYLVRMLPDTSGIRGVVHACDSLDEACEFACAVSGDVFDRLTLRVVAAREVV